MPKRKNALKIGLTGGIGAGKSMIAKIFETLDVTVFNADERARYLMENSEDLIRNIRDNFGSATYINGKLNRSYLSENIFNDTGKLEKLNALVHPAVFKDYDQWLEKQDHLPYTIKEAALLFEAGSHKDLDKIIVVYAPMELRIQRVLLRDPNRTRKEVEGIIRNQMDEEKKKKLADYVIINDNRKLVIHQVISIHEKILKLTH